MTQFIVVFLAKLSIYLWFHAVTSGMESTENVYFSQKDHWQSFVHSNCFWSLSAALSARFDQHYWTELQQ